MCLWTAKLIVWAKHYIWRQLGIFSYIVRIACIVTHKWYHMLFTVGSCQSSTPVKLPLCDSRWIEAFRSFCSTQVQTYFHIIPNIRFSVSRTKVIDDQSDYFDMDGNRWLSKKEKLGLSKKEDEMRKKKYQQRHTRDITVTLDFAGRLHCCHCHCNVTCSGFINADLCFHIM